MFEADTTTGRECFTLSITDDDIFEDAELFRVILQPTDDPTINLVTSVLTITIIDDDSKSLVQTNPPLFFKTQVLYVPPHPHPPGVSVTFAESAYSVEEQELVFDVCATLDGAIEVDVIVLLTAQEDNQTSLNARASSK